MGLSYPQAKAGLLAQGVDAATADLFLSWVHLHPTIWKEFERKTLVLIAKGIPHYGAKAIAETIRYDRTIEKCCEFKMNNNFPAYLARLFILKHPQHKNFFEFRRIEGLQAA